MCVWEVLRLGWVHPLPSNWGREVRSNRRARGPALSAIFTPSLLGLQVSGAASFAGFKRPCPYLPSGFIPSLVMVREVPTGEG